MPGYRDPIRMGDVPSRATALATNAENIVNQSVSTRSWTQMGSDWLSKAASPFVTLLSWVTSVVGTIGKEFAAKKTGEFAVTGVAMLVGGPFAAISARVAFISVGSLADLFKLIPESVLTSAAEAINDYSGDQQKDIVKTVAGYASQRIRGTVQAPAATEPPQEIAQRIVEKSAELMVRLQQYRELTDKYQQGTMRLRYCDDAVALSSGFYQLDALRSKIAGDLTTLKAWVLTQQQLVDGIDLQSVKTGNLVPILQTFLTDPNIPHYTAYSWNIISRASQCSEAYCYGKGV